MSTDDTPTHLSTSPAAVSVHDTIRNARLRISARSDPGKVRPNNEDRYLALRLTRSTTPIVTNIDPAQLDFVPEQIRWGLAVADGMGGHAAGEVASTLALTLALQLSQHGSQWFTKNGEEEARAMVTRMQSILEAVDRAIAERSRSEAGLAGMGTTLTLAAIDGAHLFVFHVGDSRCYLLRGGQLRRLTRDQTLTQELVDAGLLAPEERQRHNMRHVLTHAVGRGDIAIEVQHLPLEHGDRLLLASDGLTDGLSDEDIQAVLVDGGCDGACSELIDRALAAGGRDNITVIVADVELQ